MKKILIIVWVLLLVALVSADDVEIPLTVTWSHIFSSYYSGTICLEETNLFGVFDNISVGYTHDDHSGSPPSPRIIHLKDQGGNKYCNDLQPTPWDLNIPADTLANALIKVEYGPNILFGDDKLSTDVPVTINDINHLFYDQRMAFNIPLNQGWNLISIPLVLFNNSIKDVFSSVNYSDIFYYDSGWKVPTEINNTLGYWVNADNEDILTVRGRLEDENPLIDVVEGWNLIGYSSLNETLINERFNNSQISTVMMYNNSKWYSYNPDRPLNSLDKFIPGFGYWFKVLEK